MLQFEKVVKGYTPRQLKVSKTELSHSVRRAKSKKGWCRFMLPVWTVNLDILTREIETRAKMIAA